MNYSLKDDGSFLIKDYNQAYPFSNFLPGIAGIWGVPLWVFYVNRAQGVVSFGIKDKDHSILEFFPANKAYSFVSTLGFRTFIKTPASFYEPFRVHSADKLRQDMLIESDSFRISETNPQLGLGISVRYFTLPNTPVGGLVRVVTIKNTSRQRISLDILDGLSRIIPFGSTQGFLKEISRTLEAWMQAELKRRLAIFRLIVDPRDVSHTKYIEGVNFNYSFYEEKGRKEHPEIIVEPQGVFNYDTSFNLPVNFLKGKLNPRFKELTRGITPCAFSHFHWRLAPGQEKVFYSIFGAAFSLAALEKFTPFLNASFLKEKEKENRQIIAALKKKAFCLSNFKNFDHYIQSSYLDNVLRGGYPYSAGQNSQGGSKNIYYIYSRKHGDLERDYNNFQLLPSHFSEGEANYRDINQNRRMDLFFAPGLEDKNVIYFFNFIKIDGYNPLLVRGEKLRLSKAAAQNILNNFNIKSARVLHILLKGFYLGELFALFSEEEVKLTQPEIFLQSLLKTAERKPQGAHSEGYWIDHWRYNLDLLENFLYFYPEKLKELFLKKEFVFWDDEYRIRPRSQRYILKLARAYQGESIEAVKEKRQLIKNRKEYRNFLRTKTGKIYKTNLIAKLLSIILNKSATLDPCGIGIEMEADKPGWCDSLNGLPALWGSSLAETLELKRACGLLSQAVKELKACGITQTLVVSEIFSFFRRMKRLLARPPKGNNADYKFWDKSNAIKEDFRQKVFFSLQGQEIKLSLTELDEFLKKLNRKLSPALKKAQDKKTGLPSSYFTYAVTKYKISNRHHIMPLAFAKNVLPLFLEGVVHTLRAEGSKHMYHKVRRSGLFDQKLKMYRLNAPLTQQSLEIGRSRAFAPGWLENESIWLHMEYKYLLELLKKRFYEEFFRDFKNCGVCFFDPAVYGRNILENSSFIVSSAYADKNLWGRGFVARLSGATAEILNIWALLCLGHAPFFLNPQKQLCLRFRPILKAEFFTRRQETVTIDGKPLFFPRDSFSFRLFSQTLVCYHNPKRQDTFGKEGARAQKIEVALAGRKVSFPSEIIPYPLSKAVRQGQASRIDIYMGR